LKTLIVIHILVDVFGYGYDSMQNEHITFKIINMNHFSSEEVVHASSTFCPPYRYGFITDLSLAILIKESMPRNYIKPVIDTILKTLPVLLKKKNYRIGIRMFRNGNLES
jgi:hypothetical protein